MNRAFPILSILPLLLALSACSGGDDGPAPPPPAPGPQVVLDQAVDETGGLVEVAAGQPHEGLRIWVPAGALAASTRLTASLVPAPGPLRSGYRLITSSWAVDFHGAALEKPFRLRMPLLAGETASEGAATLRWDPATSGWDPALLARIDASPDGAVVAADVDGTFAAVARFHGPELSASAPGFAVASDVPNVSSTAGEGCRFGATLLARHEHARGRAGLFSRFDAAASLMVAEQAEARHRIARLGHPQGVAAEQQAAATEVRDAVKLALGATGRPVWVLLTDRIPLLVYAYLGNAFEAYNPRVGATSAPLYFTGTEFNYFSTAYATVGATGGDPSFEAEIESLLADFSTADAPALTQNVGTAGATLTVSSGALAGTIVEIGAGDLGAATDVVVAQPGWAPPLPAGAELCSPFVKVTGPPDNLYLGQVAVTLTYAQPASADESKLQLGCFIPKNDCWSLAQVANRDAAANTIRALCRTAGIYAVFGHGPLPDGTTTAASSTFIYHAWPSGETEQNVVDTLVARKIRRLHISAVEHVGFCSYLCRFPLEAGMTGATGLSHSSTWFDYSTLMAAAHAAGIQVVFAITIFSSTIPPDDPDTPGTHAYHLVRTVIPFLRDQCPELDGIMLDYIRQDVGTWTEADRDLVSRIVARIREQLGHKALSRPHRLYACVWCFTAGNEDGRLAVAQRYSDFARDCDVLAPMMYGGNDPYPAADLEWYAARTSLYRMPRNRLETLGGVMTYGNATPTTVRDHLQAVLRWRMDGFATYRYDLTDAAEWDAADDFCSP